MNSTLMIMTTYLQMGFFADVGPMQIFVSIHLIPPDLKFNPNANPPCFENEEQKIERGAMVRVKIMGLRMDVKDIVPASHKKTTNDSLLSARSRRITLGLFENSILHVYDDFWFCFFLIGFFRC
jgi:DNA-directed RNA polymerase subunit E'/Rpb7